MVARGVSRRVRALVAVATASSALALVLSGCTSSPPPPSNTTGSSSGGPTATTTPTVPLAAPTFAPTGSAAQNLRFFDYVNSRTITRYRTPSGQQFVDGLAAAGFSKSDMQLTAPRTTIDLQPASVQFSVLINGGCLIGQFGTAIGGYHSMTAAKLATGKCLIGDTVPVG